MTTKVANYCVSIDVGSHYTKAGFTNDSFPRCVFSSVVGRFRKSGLTDGYPDIYCGKEAMKNRGFSQLTWPVKNGMVSDWEEMEKLWHHMFYLEMHVPPEEASVIHVIHPLTSRKDKERIAERMFESLAVRSLYLAKSPAMILHAGGRTTGLAWENGACCAHASPVFEGFTLRHSTVTSELHGEKITDILQKHMKDNGYLFTTPMERDILDKIKAEVCFVAEDYDSEMISLSKSAESKVRFKLPDGQTIYLGRERFLSTEILFQPSLQNLASSSIVNSICSSIEKCDMDHRFTYYNNIVLAGGSTMFPGFAKRLREELRLKTANLEGCKVNVDAWPSRQYAAWEGASIIGSLSSMRGFSVTREEYEDIGPDRVHHKFF